MISYPAEIRREAAKTKDRDEKRILEGPKPKHPENKMDREARIIRHRKAIEELLQLVCPHGCGAIIYMDFTGCLAVECLNCKNEFCAWCFELYATAQHGGQTHGRCIAHVKTCPSNPYPGEFRKGAGTEIIDYTDHRVVPERQRKVEQYLQQRVDAGDREAVLVAIQGALRNLHVDLKGLRVTEQVKAAVGAPAPSLAPRTLTRHSQQIADQTPAESRQDVAHFLVGIANAVVKGRISEMERGNLKNMLLGGLPHNDPAFIGYRDAGREDLAVIRHALGGEQPPPHLECPIGNSLLVDPVFTADGITYSRHNIEAWFAMGNATSPVTRVQLASTALIPNRVAQDAVEVWCRLTSNALPQAETRSPRRVNGQGAAYDAAPDAPECHGHSDDEGLARSVRGATSASPRALAQPQFQMHQSQKKGGAVQPGPRAAPTAARGATPTAPAAASGSDDPGLVQWRLFVDEERRREKIMRCCPRCSRQFHRYDGCDTIVCGRAVAHSESTAGQVPGCGYRFEIQQALRYPLEANLRDHPLYARYGHLPDGRGGGGAGVGIGPGETTCPYCGVTCRSHAKLLNHMELRCIRRPPGTRPPQEPSAPSPGRAGGGAASSVPPAAAARRPNNGRLSVGAENRCQFCRGYYRQCFGSYGMRDRNGTGIWRSTDANSDLADLTLFPESPNDRFCCQACEGCERAASHASTRLLSSIQESDSDDDGFRSCRQA